jgi:phosphopantothenoylcysteine decarboxylase / phosphopantothenate---cysteine ligase
MSFLAGKTVVLGVTGGISAYKAAELCRLLRKADVRVRVVMTRAATQFITPLTLQTLSGEKVALDLFDLEGEAEIGHIRLADEADLIVVAPATADAIARLAAGMADDLLTAVVLASRAPCCWRRP